MHKIAITKKKIRFFEKTNENWQMRGHAEKEEKRKKIFMKETEFVL